MRRQLKPPNPPLNFPLVDSCQTVKKTVNGDQDEEEGAKVTRDIIMSLTIHGMSIKIHALEETPPPYSPAPTYYYAGDYDRPLPENRKRRFGNPARQPTSGWGGPGVGRPLVLSGATLRGGPHFQATRLV